MVYTLYIVRFEGKFKYKPILKGDLAWPHGCMLLACNFINSWQCKKYAMSKIQLKVKNNTRNLEQHEVIPC